jgi:acyl-CoA thioesterase FadM
VAWLGKLGSRQIRFEYRVETGGRLLATGWTLHVPLGPEGRPRPFPRELRDHLEGYVEAEAADDLL